MASRIAGITVEINGDTTQLSKSLEDVNKNIRSTQSQLKDVEKLLKLDPTNTELLAQKQRLLTDAVSDTSQKLETLKTAAQQAQGQLERGEISQNQFEALQREIIVTTNSLNQYQSELEGMANAQDEAGNAAEDLDSALDKAGDEAGQASDSMDDLSDSAKDSENSFSVAKEAVATFIGNALTSLVASVKDAVASFAEISESTMEFRENMAKLETTAQSAGYTTEYANEAFRQMYGVMGDETAANTTISNFMKLGASTENLNSLLDSATGIWATYGDSIPLDGLAESVNETAKVGQITGNLADALNWAGVSEDDFNESLAACGDEQQRQQLIVDTLNDLYADSAAAYEENNASIISAREANLQYEQAMAKVGAAFEPLITQMTAMKGEILSGLLPGLESLSTAFQNLFAGDTGASDDIAAAISEMVSGVLDQVQALLPQVLAAVSGLLSGVISGIQESVPELTSTITDILQSLVSMLTAIIPDLIVALISMANSLASELISLAPGLVSAALQLFSGIAEAL